MYDTDGVIFTKDKCLFCVNLCVVLVFMHLFSWVFPVYVVYIHLVLLCINFCICRSLSSSYNGIKIHNFLCWISQIRDVDDTMSYQSSNFNIEPRWFELTECWSENCKKLNSWFCLQVAWRNYYSGRWKNYWKIS